MRKKLYIIFLILFLIISFTNATFYRASAIATNSSMYSTNVNTNESQSKLENDLILRVFSPCIAKSIQAYYGEPRQFSLWDAKILKITRLTSGSFNFEITISVKTFTGAHNPPYGLETVTIRLDDSGTHIINFNHTNG